MQELVVVYLGGGSSTGTRFGAGSRVGFGSGDSALSSRSTFFLPCRAVVGCSFMLPSTARSLEAGLAVLLSVPWDSALSMAVTRWVAVSLTVVTVGLG